MGRVIKYQTVERVSSALRHRAEQVATEICSRYAWPGCEPIMLHPWPRGVDSDHLSGESDVGDAADAVSPAEGRPSLPCGGLPQLVSVLCEISAEWGLAWRLSWDDASAKVGAIEEGRCDAGVFDHVLGRREEDPSAERPPVVSLPEMNRGKMRLADFLVDTWGGADLSRIGIQISDDGDSGDFGEGTIPLAPFQTSEEPRSEEGAGPYEGPPVLPFPQSEAR